MMITGAKSYPASRGITAASRFLLLTGWLAGLALAMQRPAAAAPPSNDRCEGALVIRGAGPFPFLTPVVDITEADRQGDPPAPSCLSANASRSTWYTFAPAQSGEYVFSVCSDTPTATTVVDTIMAIYSSANGCLGPLIELPGGCADDSCGASGLQSRLMVQLAAGTTYYAVVWQWDDAPPSASVRSLQLAVWKFARAGNETCSQALPVLLGQAVTGSSQGATNSYELSDSACFAGIGQDPSTAPGPDVVYTFTAPAAGHYFIKVYDYSMLSDLVLYVLGSCPPGPFPAAATDCLGAANRSSLSSSEALVCAELASNQQVYIVVDEAVAENGGSTFFLHVTPCVMELEPNNQLTNANPVSVGLVGAIQEFGDDDYFTLGAPPPGARLFAVVDGEAANLPDLDLRAVTATTLLEYDDDNNDSSLGDTAPNLAGTPLPGDPVFLHVNFNNFFTLAEPYNLYAVVQPPLAQATVEVEPNDLLPQAQTAANNYFFGELAQPAPSPDLDLYRFTVEPGDLVYLGLDGDPLRNDTPINAQLELLDEMGRVLAAANDGASDSTSNLLSGTLEESLPHSPGEALLFRAPLKGTYYVRVSIGSASTASEGAGDYLLSISRNGVAGSDGTNHPPQFQNLFVQSPVGTGQVATLRGELADADLGQTWTVTVNWGDNSEPAIVPVWIGDNTFAVDHVFLEPPPGPDGSYYLVSVTAVDNLGGAGMAQAQVVVYPVQPARFLSIARELDGSVRLQLEGSANTAYDLWASGDLFEWVFLESRSADATGRFEFIDSSQPRPSRRFYRAVVP